LNIIEQPASKEIVSPARIQEKADILETNLFKSISKQTDPSKMHIKINRANFPDAVINKALLHLMPRFNVNPRDYLLGLRDLLQKDIPSDKLEKFEKNLDDTEEKFYDDLNVTTRSFEAIASKKELEIIVRGIPAIKSINGQIARFLFQPRTKPGGTLKRRGD